MPTPVALASHNADVQHASFNENFCVMGATVPAGSLVLVAIVADPNAGAVSAVVDSQSNVYTLVDSGVRGSGSAGVAAEIWSSVLVTGLSAVEGVDVLWSSNAVARVMQVSAWTDASALEDVTSQVLSTNSGSPSLGPITPVDPDCLIFVLHALEVDGLGGTPPAGFTTVSEDFSTGGGSNSNVTCWTAYLVETTATAKTWNPTVGFTVNQVIILAAFQHAGAAPPPNVNTSARFLLGIDSVVDAAFTGITIGGTSPLGGVATDVSLVFDVETSVDGGNALGDFDLGDPMRFKAQFYDLHDDKVPRDPTTVKLRIKKPASGDVITVTFPDDVTLVHDITGSFHYDGIATEAGEWEIRWEGTGDVIAADDSKKVVKKSVFYPTDILT